jgi:hypothetical protein
MSMATLVSSSRGWALQFILPAGWSAGHGHLTHMENEPCRTDSPTRLDSIRHLEGGGHSYRRRREP